MPAGMAVTVLKNTDKHLHLVLPPAPSDELSDEALAGIDTSVTVPVHAALPRQPNRAFCVVTLWIMLRVISKY